MKSVCYRLFGVFFANRLTYGHVLYCRKLGARLSCDTLAFLVLKANLNISPSKTSFQIPPSSWNPSSSGPQLFLDPVKLPFFDRVSRRPAPYAQSVPQPSSASSPPEALLPPQSVQPTCHSTHTLFVQSFFLALFIHRLTPMAQPSPSLLHRPTSVRSRSAQNSQSSILSYTALAQLLIHGTLGRLPWYRSSCSQICPPGSCQVQIAKGDKKELYAIRSYSLRCFNHLAVCLWKTWNIFEAREWLDFGEVGLTRESSSGCVI